MSNCPKCGAERQAESIFCDKCGLNYETLLCAQASSATPYPSIPEEIIIVKRKSLKINKVGFVNGIVAILFGFFILGLADDSNYTNYTEYGADFYTGVSKEFAQVELILQSVSKSISYGIGLLLIVSGIYMICYFVNKINETKAGKI